MKTKKELIQIDKQHIWHPFTQMADWVKDEPSLPLIIKSGKGNYLYDYDGKKYIDGVSSLWVTVHGHRKREIDNAVKKQLGEIAHTTFLGLTHESAIRLAKELVNIAPKGLTRVFYSDNGSTSVEIALKMAYQYCQQTQINTKKTSFLSLRNAYHGDTVGSVSVGGMDLFHSKFKSLLFKTFFASSPYCYRCNFKKSCNLQCLKQVEDILKKNHSQIAAAIIEPMIQAAAGMLTMPAGYMKSFEKLCRKYNVLLICDEVATGFGRTGKMFAVEHESIKPDFLCLAKGITGGYLPLAVTLTTEKIYQAFLGKLEEFKTFYHGHTYTANPLACAAALANLEIFNREKTVKKLKPKVTLLKNELEKLKTLSCVGDIRQIGLMTGIELVKDKNKGTNFNPEDKIGIKVCAECRKYGLIVRPLGDVIVLMPPLSITEQEIKRIINILHVILNKLFSFKNPFKASSEFVVGSS